MEFLEIDALQRTHEYKQLVAILTRCGEKASCRICAEFAKLLIDEKKASYDAGVFFAELYRKGPLESSATAKSEKPLASEELDDLAMKFEILNKYERLALSLLKK